MRRVSDGLDASRVSRHEVRSSFRSPVNASQLQKPRTPASVIGNPGDARGESPAVVSARPQVRLQPAIANVGGVQIQFSQSRQQR